MPPKTKSLSVPETMRPRYEEITALTDALCREKLNDEYAQVCREMTATLARKRPRFLEPLLPAQRTLHRLHEATNQREVLGASTKTVLLAATMNYRVDTDP